MDYQNANHQTPLTPDDDMWFHYFDQDHTHLYIDDVTHAYQFSNLLDLNRVLPLKQDQDYFSELGFPFFDSVDEILSLWDNGDLQIFSFNDDHSIETKTTASGGGSGQHGGRKGWQQLRQLDLEEIEKHFEMPITMAAEKLGVGLTLLKKRCRELNIKRWPHRKLKSIKSLIQNVKEMGLDEELELLEEQKTMIKKLPEMDLTQRTKKLRQSCFKANYKKRRLNSPSLSLNQL